MKYKISGLKWGEIWKTGPARQRWRRQSKKRLRSMLKKELRDALKFIEV